jgi:hypothetical protein
VPTTSTKPSLRQVRIGAHGSERREVFGPVPDHVEELTRPVQHCRKLDGAELRHRDNRSGPPRDEPIDAAVPGAEGAGVGVREPEWRGVVECGDLMPDNDGSRAGEADEQPTTGQLR